MLLKEAAMKNMDDAIEAQYRELVDTVRADVEPSMDLPSLYAKFGLGEDLNMSTHVVTKHLHAEITRIIGTVVPKGPKLSLRNLKNQILIRHFCDGASVDPYLHLLDTVMDATRQHGWEIAAIDESQEAWRTALTAAANHFSISPYSPLNSQDLIVRNNKRQYAVAQAIIALRENGFQVMVRGGLAIIEQEEQQRIAANIESLTREAGGLEMVATIFNRIRNEYDSKNERYHVIRRPSQIDGSAIPSSPIGYLLNLAVKNSAQAHSLSPGRPAAAAEEAINLATAFATTFDLQPYNQFEVMFHAGTGLMRFLQEITVYDGMFTLKQSRPSDVERTLRGLFGWLSDADAISRLGFTIGNAVLVARWLMERGLVVRGPIHFQDTDIYGQLSAMESSVLDRVLAAYTHENQVNARFSLPNEQQAVDFWFRPLLIQPLGYRYLADASWCAPAFYEAILAALRAAKIPELDSKIGKAFETLVKGELASHGVTHVCGKYHQNGVEGECDLVVETEDTIILFELKKKALTRAARAGSDIDIIFDIAESLLAAHEQAGKHECLLYEAGFIDLDDGGSRYRLERRNRRVERIALSLLEFGATQDRNLLFQVMQTVTEFDFGSTDQSHHKKVCAVQNICQELKDQYVRLTQIHDAKHALFFMNCWFLSIGHLRQILDGVTSNEEFKKSLFVTRHVTMTTLDFYFEHAECLRMKVAAPQPGVTT